MTARFRRALVAISALAMVRRDRFVEWRQGVSTQTAVHCSKRNPWRVPNVHQMHCAVRWRGDAGFLVYVGFPDAAEGFDDLLIRTLGGLGVVQTDQTFADASRAAVVDLISGSPPKAPARRCINLKPATRW